MFRETPHLTIANGVVRDYLSLLDRIVGLGKRNPAIIPVEEQFRYQAIVNESKVNARLIRKRFQYQLKTLRDIADCETRLTGIFFHEVNLKQLQDFVYDENLLLNNTLFNLPYRVRSVLLLVENSMYGAARPVLRQAFEQMILAKQSQVEPNVTTRWQDQERLGVGEVLAHLMEKGKDFSALGQFWGTLNRVTHATRESMQPLLIPQTQAPLEVEPWFIRRPHGDPAHEHMSVLEGLIANSMFTLDMLYVILGMNLHLLVGDFGRKARGYFPASRDPEDISEHERKLKTKARYLLGGYSSRIPSKGSIFFRRVIFQFRQDWANRT